ncbi:DNA-directed RNA polymerase III subunit rpc8 [Psilocybe cubensis]|uniref:Polymerase III polypeptide H n=2 Tax=Psilocybe cubensis TaxID=181762 RepID=A0A8H8CH52_PSICU|nr:DNA-directed RNA polymerase III subunit rpc8 [Psilocybe cubensis]KAH9479096.1 DNA-directed RNA polymerase III subunit rpc8 [Psilocybe cubensis]
MFCLSVVKDTIPLHPSTFGAPPADALIAALNKKYANRVLHTVGLCICVFDLSQAGEGKVRYGDGLLWYKVVFRLVVFRPFTSEVLIGKVKSSDEDGIRVTLGFFDDMYIPASYLPQPTAFDPNERAHFWIPDSPLTTATELLDTPLSSRMYIDQGEVVRVRVESDEFCDFEPGPPRAVDGVFAGVGKEGSGTGGRAPYLVCCSIAEQGLGPVAWWSGSQEEDGGEDGEGDEDGEGGETMDEG